MHTVLQQDVRAKQPFDKSHERRIEGINKTVVAMQAEVEKTKAQNTTADAGMQDNAAAGRRQFRFRLRVRARRRTTPRQRASTK